jgi:phosphatidate cytidylyltransferase
MIGGAADDDDTVLPPATAAGAPDLDDSTGDDSTDPGAVEATGDSDDDEDDVLSWEDARTLEEADTGELDLWVSDVPEGTESESDSDSADTDTDPGPGDVAGAGEVFDFDDFTEESYVQTATKEHAGLAAHIARAATEDTEQVPLTATMPGVETGTVGFEDVVGEDEAQIVTPPSRGGSELALRVGSGIALVALVVVSLLWAPAMAVLAGVVFLIAGWEFYAALISRRYHPLSLFGLLGIAGASIGAYFDASGAIPIALALTVAAALLFDAVAPRKAQPAVNFALTILVAAWISLGAFAFDIINAVDYQILVGAIVAIVALVDIAQYFVGRSFGRRQLAPVISPKKTIEGLMGGVVTALILGAALSFVAPFDLGSGLLIGAVVAVFAPLGDLAVSGVKRSLDIKDMGSILPGHGGLLDRIDALLFVIPAAWVAYTWLGLL